MKLMQFLGDDLSKDAIDLLPHGLNAHLKIKNSFAGFKEMLRWLTVQKIDITSVFLVMEHIGLYSFHFEKFLHQHHIKFAKVSGYAIKRSLGLVRGKNDKIDAQRIARYGFEKQDLLVPEIPIDTGLQRLQVLHSTRDRLVKHRSSLICAIKECRLILKAIDPVIISQEKLVENFSEQIKSIELQIKHCLADAEKSVSNNFKLLTSIKAVGPVVATATILKTRNFTRFKNGRKFSCYSGSAPFDHTSGTSIKKKTRVSHLADKEMKTLLTQAAKCAIQHDKELKDFYERRLKMGKSKKSTINVVRNKIIFRMFAVIKRQTPFINEYQKAA
jgi:transposase